MKLPNSTICQKNFNIISYRVSVPGGVVEAPGAPAGRNNKKIVSIGLNELNSDNSCDNSMRKHKRKFDSDV